MTYRTRAQAKFPEYRIPEFGSCCNIVLHIVAVRCNCIWISYIVAVFIYCCIVLHIVAVCYIYLWIPPFCLSVPQTAEHPHSQTVAGCGRVLQGVAGCCRVLQLYSIPQTAEHTHIRLLQRVVVCCNVLQGVAVCCSVLQCVAVVLYTPDS